MAQLILQPPLRKRDNIDTIGVTDAIIGLLMLSHIVAAHRTPCN